MHDADGQCDARLQPLANRRHVRQLPRLDVADPGDRIARTDAGSCSGRPVPHPDNDHAAGHRPQIDAERSQLLFDAAGNLEPSLIRLRRLIKSAELGQEGGLRGQQPLPLGDRLVRRALRQ